MKREPFLSFVLPLVLFFAGCPAPLSAPPTSPPEPVSAGKSPSTSDISGLLTRVDQTLAANQQGRTLRTGIHGGWQVLHGVLAYGDQFEVETPDGPRPAVQFLAGGGSVDGFDPMPGDLLGDPPRTGLRMELQPTTKVGQGHRDQWLAVLAQAGLKLSDTIRSGSQLFQVEDWVRQVEWDTPLNVEEEFSWTLIALSAYRNSDHRWEARDGNTYSIETLLAVELSKDLPQSACGGTHRLIGIAHSLRKRKREGRPVNGVWKQAEELLEGSIQQARQNQNGDGSYSLSYHHRAGGIRDLGDALGSTGHVLEFVATAADTETLRQAWVQRCVVKLCDLLDQCTAFNLECGVLYHALHGLQEYRERMSEPG
ncbi:MAG: hypothetical protein AAGA03_10215 [Planctomycetota bacterium]